METRLMICLAILGALIILAFAFKRFVKKIENVPVNIMHQEYAELMRKIADAGTYHELVELEKDIDQFDYKYQCNEDCAGFVSQLFFERQEKKHAFYRAMVELRPA